MRHLEVTDVTGRTWTSDPDTDGEITDDVIPQIVGALENFSEITTLRLEIGGTSHYFNPANIVCWRIVEVEL